MKTTIHKASSRGHINYGWLDSHHTFSFADYYNPERIHFGKLRVLNDDIVAPGKGFGKHPHDNMEIISIPVKGSLMHEDSMGHRQIISEDEVQVMSAGTGIIHSEINASNNEAVNFLQIWILPDKKNIKPVYDQKYFDRENAKNKWQILIDNENDSLKINQKATISRLYLQRGNAISYKTKDNNSKCYLFVIDGEFAINDNIISKRDGIGIENCSEFKLNALEDSYLINIEL